MQKPRIAVVVEGGVVQGVFADLPVDVYIVDFDTEGADAEDIIVLHKKGEQQEGGGEYHEDEECYMSWWTILSSDVDLEYLNKIEKLYREHNVDFVDVEGADHVA